MSTNKQLGFHAIELVLALAVLGVVGFAGYLVYNHSKTPATVANYTQSVPSAPAINSAQDLTTAANTVSQLNISGNMADLTTLQNDLNSL